MNTFVQTSNNEINDQIEFFDHEIENLKSLISENHYMNPEQEDELEELITKAIKFGELCGRRDHAQNQLEGFVLVNSENINSFYQDDNEPENFCNSCDDLDALGDCIDHDEIMIVNKHTSAHISTEKLYGAWGVIETSYGTAWKFKLFNTEDEAKSAILEAQG